MRTFTDTEIDLCKKIAEKAEKGKTNEEMNPIYMTKGDWYYDEKEKRVRLYNGRGLNFLGALTIEWLPLWQEHDCLEWLRKKGMLIKSAYDVHDGFMLYTNFFNFSDSSKKGFHGKTPLEALLRAVLAVMEES